MGNSLIIGSTSQLSHYFPKSFHRISSRDVNIESIRNGKYECVYILFSEQRTFLNENEDFFIDINVRYTMSLINDIKDYVDNIVVYSTSELWNNYDGKVSVNDKYDYNYSPYIKSKQVLCDTINENRDKYPNVNIIYPFNFNSPYRKEGFLFSKLFDSIMNKKQNTIGDINFNRDLIHPKIIVEQSINTTEDKLVGGGSLINVKDLVKDLFIKSEMKYEDYIVENITNNLPNKRKEYYSSIMYSNYDELLNLTIKDIYEYKIS